MDEWMVLTGGEAAHRQAEQRAMRQGAPAREWSGIGRRVRTALAATLVALAARIAPLPGLPARGNGESLASVQG